MVEYVWQQADDAVAIGEQRARLATLAEQLEERLDDARLAGERERQLEDELVTERHALDARGRWVADALARDSR